MKYCIYFSFLLICISINGQSNVTVPALEKDSFFESKLTGESFFENKQYLGDQYFNNDWAISDILLSSGEMVKNKNLKYNGLFDEVIWMNSSNYGKYKLDKSFISEFWLKIAPGSTLHFKRIHVDGPNESHPFDIFVQVKVEGKVSLYIHHKITITGEENLYVNNNLYYFNRIGKMPVYYIKLITNRYVKMSGIRLSSFLKVFPEEKKEITKLLKENHLKIKTENDLIKAIGLLNKQVFLEN